MVIERIIKSRDKVKLILSDNTSYRISESTLAKYLLFQGKEIDKDHLLELIEDDLQGDIISASIDLISRRPRSIYEIKTYIRNKYKDQLLPDFETKIISYLIEKGYLDDDAFCKWWIDNRNSFRPKSLMELNKELSDHGIDPDTIRASLNKYYDSDIEKELLRSLLKKKFNLENISNLPIKEKQRIISYFLRKGYNYDLIKEELT
jgi:regulatory protein